MTREDRTVEGKVRRYYRITGAGEAALAEVRAPVRELFHEVLEESPPVTRS